jgi:hypothetical protein
MACSICMLCRSPVQLLLLRHVHSTQAPPKNATALGTIPCRCTSWNSSISCRVPSKAQTPPLRYRHHHTCIALHIHGRIHSMHCNCTAIQSSSHAHAPTSLPQHFRSSHKPAEPPPSSAATSPSSLIILSRHHTYTLPCHHVPHRAHPATIRFQA